MNTNPYKPGDQVYVDGEGYQLFTVHTVYSDTKVSLGLADYPDTEQDYQIAVSRLIKVKA